jgi:hypothetical protein
VTGYFKLSDNNRLFFLWASSVTLEPTHLPQEAIDSLGTISGRYSPPIMVPKFLGSNKNALDDKEDVVGYKPVPGTPCRLCQSTGDAACNYCVTYSMLMQSVKQEADLQNVRAQAEELLPAPPQPESHASALCSDARASPPRHTHTHTHTHTHLPTELRTLLLNAEGSRSLWEQARLLREGMRSLGLDDRDPLSGRTLPALIH